MKIFITTVLMIIFSSLIIQNSWGWSDEYNYNNNNPNQSGSPGTASTAGSAQSSQGLQSALQVFQNVDCQDLGCKPTKQDFFDNSGSANTQKTFQIKPSTSADSESADLNSASSSSSSFN